MGQQKKHDKCAAEVSMLASGSDVLQCGLVNLPTADCSSQPTSQLRPHAAKLTPVEGSLTPAILESARGGRLNPLLMACGNNALPAAQRAELQMQQARAVNLPYFAKGTCFVPHNSMLFEIEAGLCDTGANATLVSDELAQRLGLPVLHIDSHMRLASGQLAGIQGKIEGPLVISLAPGDRDACVVFEIPNVYVVKNPRVYGILFGFAAFKPVLGQVNVVEEVLEYSPKLHVSGIYPRATVPLVCNTSHLHVHTVQISMARVETNDIPAQDNALKQTLGDDYRSEDGQGEEGNHPRHERRRDHNRRERSRSRTRHDHRGRSPDRYRHSGPERRIYHGPTSIQTERSQRPYAVGRERYHPYSRPALNSRQDADICRGLRVEHSPRHDLRYVEGPRGQQTRAVPQLPLQPYETVGTGFVPQSSQAPWGEVFDPRTDNTRLFYKDVRPLPAYLCQQMKGSMYVDVYATYQLEGTK